MWAPPLSSPATCVPDTPLIPSHCVPLDALFSPQAAVNFAIFSSSATAVSLCLFTEADLQVGKRGRGVLVLGDGGRLAVTALFTEADVQVGKGGRGAAVEELLPHGGRLLGDPWGREPPRSALFTAGATKGGCRPHQEEACFDLYQWAAFQNRPRCVDPSHVSLGGSHLWSRLRDMEAVLWMQMTGGDRWEGCRWGWEVGQIDCRGAGLTKAD